MPKSPPSRRVALIMAGGSGERFWPLSRGKRPKQLLRLTSDKETMLEESVRRIAPLIGAENVFVATTRELAPSIRAAEVGVADENVLAEPARRNTSGCLAWAAAIMMARFPGETVTMAVLTADHAIGTPAKFRSCVRAAMTAAEKNNAIVTIGVKPTRPETGYGYIEAVRSVPGQRGVRRVARFREKPYYDLALQFLDSGHHYWNSGMFFWKVGTFVSELAAASPIHGDVIEDIVDDLARNRRKAAEKNFERLPDVSIDYALMEKTKNVLMVEATFPWDDVGAWDALERSRKPDATGNVVEGGAVLVHTTGSIVINDAGPEKMAVAVVGGENLVVIVTHDAVLVVPKHAVQEVRQAARELKNRGAKQV